MSTVNRCFLDTLDVQVAERSKELSDLLRQKEKVESQILELQQWLDRARALRELEAKTMGIAEVSEPYRLAGQRFFGMAPRQAVRTLLQERASATRSELVEELRSGGFQFGRKSPNRVVHFAVVRDQHIKKDGEVYRWQDDVNEKEDAKSSKLAGNNA